MAGIEIGWAIDKGVNVLQLSYKIYEAFADPERNAPQQFRNLANEFNAFHVVFEQLITLLKQYDKPLLVSPSSIQFTLNKCRLLQQKFSALNEVSTKATVARKFKFIGRTLQWSFQAEKLANELRAELASHERILTLVTQTINLEHNFEKRVENIETRESNRELFRLLQNLDVQERSQDGDSLYLPNVPRHELAPSLHTRYHLPEVPSHEPSRRELTRSANLEAAYHDLEALERLLKTESHAVAELELPGSNSSMSGAVDFIDLARHEVEIQLDRVKNYRKRISRLPSRSQTLSSHTTRESSRPSSPVLSRVNTLQDESRPGNSSRRRSTLTRLVSQVVPEGSPVLSEGLEIEIGREQINAEAMIQSQQRPLRKRMNSVATMSSSELQRYLDEFKKDLEESDIDAQINNTRNELFDLMQRSFPPSPDLRIEPPDSQLGMFRFSYGLEGGLSSSPPRSSEFQSQHRRTTFRSTTTRAGSITAGSWRYLATGVHIDDLTYSCSRCGSIEDTALQFARRLSNGLSFRLLCINPKHKPSDGLLFRHDLSSSSPTYPHVYHCGADERSCNSVRVLGQPSKLEAYTAGQRIALQIQPSAGPFYKFVSPEDSEAFQQLVYGAELVKRFDVTSIASSANSKTPCRYLPVRIWRSLSTGILSVMLHSTLVDKHEPFTYVEKASAVSVTTTSSTKIKIRVNDTLQSPWIGHKRTKSRDSAMSIESDEMRAGGRVSPRVIAKIEWLEIEFGNRADRDSFVTIWNQT